MPLALPQVLLVDDDALVRTMTAEALRDAGFEVTEAETGDEAAGVLEKSSGFDVMVTDMQMPGILDGLALAARARLQQPVIPVIIVSGYAAQLMDRLRALHPAAVFIRKPYTLKDIVDTLLRITLKI